MLSWMFYYSTVHNSLSAAQRNSRDIIPAIWEMATIMWQDSVVVKYIYTYIYLRVFCRKLTISWCVVFSGQHRMKLSTSFLCPIFYNMDVKGFYGSTSTHQRYYVLRLSICSSIYPFVSLSIHLSNQPLPGWPNDCLSIHLSGLVSGHYLENAWKE